MSIMVDLPSAMAQEAREYATVQDRGGTGFVPSALGKVALVATALCVATAPSLSFAGGEKRPMALVVMVDGLRADATQTGDMPNYERLRVGKWQVGYKAAWSVTGQIAPGSAPSSAPNHVSIATGVNPATHGVTSNAILENGTPSAVATWLKRITDAKAGTSALFVYSWSPDGNIAPSEGVEYMGNSDADNAVALAARLASANAPDATLYFIDAVDHAGHAGYYYPMSAGYRAAVAEVDGYIGACLNAIASRPTFAEEDWLVAVVSDHGGYSNQHGTITAGRHGDTVPLVISGTAMTQGRIPGMPYNFDVAASVLAHFGVTFPELQATLRDGAAEAAPRTLDDGLAVYLPFNDTETANAAPGSSIAPETNGAPAVVANGMVGKYLKISSGSSLVLPGTDTASLSYEDSNRSFSAVVWARYDVSKQTSSANANDDPVLFGNKNWSGNAKGVIYAARMRKQLGSTYYVGAGFNAGSGANNQTQGSGRLDFYPFDVESSSLWSFYAVTCSNGMITVYQGRSDGTLGWSCGMYNGFTLESGSPFYIGTDATGDYGKKFVGDIDDFALWTRPLSHEDIRRIYECGRAGMELGDLLKVDANDAPTMEVSSSEGEYTLTFGGRRTMTHGLYVAYGSNDAGTDKCAWDAFEKIADIPASTTTYTYAVPDALKAANAKFRFFLMQTDSLPYAKEVEYAHSDGSAWIDTGIAPRRDLVAEFDIQLTAKNTTGNYDWMFGSFGTAKNSNYGLNHFYNISKSDSNNNKWDQELTGGGKFKGESLLNTAYHIAFGVASYTVNGVAYTTEATVAGFVETGYPIHLFRNEKIGSGKGADGNQYDQTMIGYFKSFALYTPKRKVRDYVPAVDAGGTVGMFDAVTGRFQSSAGTALTAGADCDATRKGWVRCVSGETYTASDATPVTATYTGLGTDPLDFTDSGNWICENTYGVVLDGAVPTIDTAVTVAGETAFAVTNGAATPVCASITFSNATPTNIMDWSGLDFSKVTANSVIDIKGRTLFLADESSAALSAFAITDSSQGEPGTVRVSVVDGATLANGGVSLTGNLKLRKEGEGTFSAAKAGQLYSGGTDVIAGTIRVGSSGSGHFGTGPVVVPAGTTYDAYGNADSAVSLVLAGGTLANTASANATLPSALTMTEDSTLAFAAISATHDMTIPEGAVWNLGGKTLSVVMDGNDPDLQVKNVTISNGTFTATVNAYNNVTKGYVQIYKLHGGDGLNLDLGNTYLRLATTGVATSQVWDFTANPPDQANVVYSHSTSRMQIYGTYTPQTVRGFNMTMMDGAVLDVSQWSGAYNCAFTNPKYNNSTANTSCTLQFAAGTITVNLEGRSDLREIAKSASPYVVTWTTKPADTVTFIFDGDTARHGYECEVCDAGLKLIPPPGFSIILR